MAAPPHPVPLPEELGVGKSLLDPEGQGTPGYRCARPGAAVVPRALPPPRLRGLGMGLGTGTGHPPAPPPSLPPSPPLLIILFLNQGIRINTSLLMLW